MSRLSSPASWPAWACALRWLIATPSAARLQYRSAPAPGPGLDRAWCHAGRWRGLQSLTRCDAGFALHRADGSVLQTDVALNATGRRPNTAGLGLAEVGVQLDQYGAIAVDADSCSSVPGIWAIGDVTNRVNLTPLAIADGRAGTALGHWRLTATPVATGSPGAGRRAFSARCHCSWRPARRHCRDGHGSPTHSRVRHGPTRCWRAQRPSRQALVDAGVNPTLFAGEVAVLERAWPGRSSIPCPPTHRVPVPRWPGIEPRRGSRWRSGFTHTQGLRPQRARRRKRR